MGRKRLRRGLKRHVYLLDAPWFWLNLAAVDFCGFFGTGAAGGTEEKMDLFDN